MRGVLERAVKEDVVAGVVALVARRGQIAFFESAGDPDRQRIFFGNWLEFFRRHLPAR